MIFPSEVLILTVACLRYVNEANPEVVRLLSVLAFASPFSKPTPRSETSNRYERIRGLAVFIVTQLLSAF
jgi:hypothetical protein